ncbi:MAG: hypothetical protein EOQ50_04865 [Mesorhizobium sp.]|uniref:hypothetical protein n=1 Tax=Mesorhizobium sp. TaxID=1871066 RepID=UPI000FE5E4E7|nr:hypothetical protein [Mesorhizobium sp.]RWB79140.1 MAG: hypothetical protein EOQ50_04865 [Mesorhizobium sp.]
MTLTRAQKRIVGDIEEILRIGGYDRWAVEETYEPDARRSQLDRMKMDMIRMKVIGDYVFVDELLSVVMISYFFPAKDFLKRYRQKKVRTFVNFVLDDLYLVRKLAAVKEIRKVDPAIASLVEKLNAIRNALAHGFTPALRREFRKTKVT